MAALQHSKIAGPKGARSDGERSGKRDSNLIDAPSGTFEELFFTFWPRIHALLERLTGDSDEAEDLALEVFLKFYREYDQLWGIVNPGGWLYRVATNLGMNALRSRYRRQWYEVLAGQSALERDAPLNPEPAAEIAEERWQVQRVLAEMNTRAARLLVLRSSGFSYLEISEILEIGSSSVGSLLSRAEKEFERHYRRLYGSME